jgi:hypothetical protein
LNRKARPPSSAAIDAAHSKRISIQNKTPKRGGGSLRAASQQIVEPLERFAPVEILFARRADLDMKILPSYRIVLLSSAVSLRTL